MPVPSLDAQAAHSCTRGHLMQIGRSIGVKWLVVAAVAAAAPACVAAAAAGAGGALYVTSRGAESLVQGQPSQVAPRVTAAFAEFQIQQTGSSTENGGDKQEFKGTKGDLEVT